MKNKIKALIVALGLSVPAILIAADEAPAQPARPEARHHHPPAAATIVVIDLNNDGVIDQAEIVNAAVALATLDANQDGSLTAEEFIGIPDRTAGHGKGHGQRGPRASDSQPQN